MSVKQDIGPFSFRDYLNKLSDEGTEIIVKSAFDVEPVVSTRGLGVTGGSVEGKIIKVGEDFIELHPHEERVLIIPISAIQGIMIRKEVGVVPQLP